MRTFVLVCAASLLFGRAAAADSPKLTLEQTIAKALVGPRARMAAGEADNAAAQLAEAKALRLPRIKATVFGTASPDIDCLDANCTRTDPINFAFRYEGLWGGGELDVSQPIIRFGASHGFSAAKAGVEAKRLLADEAAGDLAVEAARAYWGLKLARELGYMLDDGIEQIQKAIARMEERTGKDAPTPQDRNRIALLLAEAEVQRADAAAGERQALAGLRALTGVPDADVDEEPLEATQFALPNEVTGAGRPQARAAREGARAADELVDFTAGSYFPQLSIAGRAWIAGAQGADDPPSIYAYDPYNRWGAELALVSTWTAEPWTVHAKVERARADARRAHALSDLAAAGARYDAETVLGEATAAKTKLDAAARGEKAGHAWVVSLVQADVIGAVESKEFADAYIAWFRMKANWAQAAFQWNVAITRLGRVNGDFRA
ncbi:MAG: TolC family protein, partial [Kofleriaceae bacterium]|nr:TolC family protein [Kofleriaceae bacterium]